METKVVSIRSHAVSRERLERERRIRARRRQKAAAQRLLAMLVCWFRALPRRTYCLAIDLMQKTIVLCLLFGILLFAFCIFLAASQWFFTFIPVTA